MQSSEGYPQGIDQNGTLDRGRNTIMAPSQLELQGQTLKIDGSNFTNVGVVNFKMTQIYYSENHEVKVPGWLSAFDLSEMHNALSKKRTPGTGTWFLHSEEFAGWVLDPHRNILWCPGIPGAGKTIIGSLVIDHLREHTQDTAVIYIYFTYKLHDQQSLATTVQTLCRQVHEICRTTELPSDFERLYISHLKHKTRPSANELLEALRTTLKQFKQVYVILDALDEYLKQYSDAKIRQLLTTAQSFGNHVKILATSRNIGEMEALFKELNAIRKEVIADPKDLAEFVDAGIATLDHFEVSAKLSQQTVQKIQEAAEGRFLMAELHMNALTRQLTPGNLEESLHSLSSEIDKTYALAMERIDTLGDVLQELSRKTLMWVACARRPMTVGELQHALATEHGRTDMTKFLPSVSTITSACVGLVVIENGKVAFVHLTTQEFFDEHRAQYFPQAHTVIGRTCLDYLLLPCFLELAPSYLSDPLSMMVLCENHPFYDYAALQWGYHLNRYGADEPLVKSILVLRQVDDRLKLAWTYTLRKMLQRRWHDDVGLDGAGLFLALYHQQKAAFLALIDKRHIPTTKNGRTPLVIAAYLGLTDFLEAMVQIWDKDDTHPKQEPDDPQLSLTQEPGEIRAHLASADIDGETSLSFAARKGHTAVFKLLLQHPATQADSPNKSGHTPLFLAASYGSDDIVRLLMEHKGVNVNHQDLKGRTALIEAARYGHSRTVELLLQYPLIDINLYDGDRWTALIFAAQYGHGSVVEILLERPEIDVNIQSCLKDGRQTALTRAVSNKDQYITELLLKCPALDINSQDTDGKTALRMAAEKGFRTLSKLLLEHPAIDVNLADHHGVSPVLAASRRGYTSALKLFLDYKQPSRPVGSLQGTVGPIKVDVNTRDKDGKSTLAIAAWYGSLRAVELLLNHPDIDPDMRCNHGCTPLVYACDSGHASVVRLLLNHTPAVNINSTDNDGDTPLMCAAYRGRTSVAKLLLDQPGIQVNVQDRLGRRTALSRACDASKGPAAGGAKKTEAEAYSFVELLLEHRDIDINLADEAGKTPLYYASRSGFQKVVELLQGRGAVIKKYGFDTG